MATIIQIANADRSLRFFTRALKLSGLEEKLNELGSFTIVGPVNFTFVNSTALSYDELLQPANKTKLADFLGEYILPGKQMFADFKNNQSLSTLKGKTVNITTNNGSTFINGAKMHGRDWQGSNGVIHALDRTYMC